MNLENILKAERYKMLAGIVDKKKETVKQYFYRKGLDITNNQDIKSYINELL